MNYYNILQVKATSSLGEIKNAYRKLAKLYHPDKGPGNEERFRQVTEAYKALTSLCKTSTQRTKCDTDVVKNYKFVHDFGRGNDIQAAVPLTLEDIDKGKVELVYIQRLFCPSCQGKGGKVFTCKVCEGTGACMEIDEARGLLVKFVSTCKECAGSGVHVEEICIHCKGKGLVDFKRHLQLVIDSKCLEQSNFTIEGKGDQGVKFGDLHLIFHIKPHSLFWYRSGKLHYTCTISHHQAKKGEQIEICTLRGVCSHTLTRTIQTGQTELIHGHGICGGDLVVHFRVEE